MSPRKPITFVNGSISGSIILRTLSIAFSILPKNPVSLFKDVIGSNTFPTAFTIASKTGSNFINILPAAVETVLNNFEAILNTALMPSRILYIMSAYSGLRTRRVSPFIFLSTVYISSSFSRTLFTLSLCFFVNDAKLSDK